MAGIATDVGATLGQQAIDMSAGSQWIDGLAKEIATMSAGTGQGSFRLLPEHLGPMRVDIRSGAEGSLVTLTVETKAAEEALVKDKGGLQHDVQLSTMRIIDVKVERVAATPRSDGGLEQNMSGGQNPYAQQNTGLQQQMAGENAGHGRQAHKLVNDDAVSSRTEPDGGGDTGATAESRRARYA